MYGENCFQTIKRLFFEVNFSFPQLLILALLLGVEISLDVFIPVSSFVIFQFYAFSLVVAISIFPLTGEVCIFKRQK
jgi:hypothetical protein